MKTTYTIHAETNDGTLHEATSVHTSKKTAIRVINGLSKLATIDVIRYVVCDADGFTVATKEIKQ